MGSALTIGADVGGTKIETALVDIQGRVVATSRRPSGMKLDPDHVAEEISACADQLGAEVEGRPIAALGLGIAGQIDSERGIVRDSPNLGWSNVPIRDHLRRVLDIPIYVTNDVQAATWGEWQRGAGQGVADLVCLFVGTGIGGGIVAGGNMISGSTGSAGELGHTILDLNGPPCHCRNHGCLEAYVGGWAIALRAQQAVAAEPREGKTMLALAEGDSEAITAATVTEAWRQGDVLAHRLVKDVGEALGAGVASIVNAFNPALLILGGGVIEGLPELIEKVRDGVQRRALPAPADSVRIEKAQLGSYAAVVGAALLARQQLATEV